MLGIVCALGAERPRGAADVAVAVGGVGRANAARAAENLAAAHQLTALISFGFAGALVPELRVGDVVVDTCVPEWQALVKGPAGRRSRLGRIVTVDRVVRDAAARRQLARETGALAVDMESDAVAAVAAARGLPFAAIRGITDTVHRDLVIDYDRCRRADGSLRPLAVLRQALASRQGMAEIPRLWYASRLASRELALFLAELPRSIGHGTLT